MITIKAAKEFKKDFFIAYTNNILKILLKTKQIKLLNVDVILQKRMSCYGGYCEKLSIVDYKISLNANRNGVNILCALAHELKHIQQFVIRDLNHIWLNEKWVYTWKGKINTKIYRNQPWEIQATTFQDSVKIKNLIKRMVL